MLELSYLRRGYREDFKVTTNVFQPKRVWYHRFPILYTLHLTSLKKETNNNIVLDTGKHKVKKKKKDRNQTRFLFYSTSCLMGCHRCGFTQDTDKVTPATASGREQILNNYKQTGEWKHSFNLKLSFIRPGTLTTMLLRRRPHPGDILSPSCPTLRGSTPGQVRTHMGKCTGCDFLKHIEDFGISLTYTAQCL